MGIRELSEQDIVESLERFDTLHRKIHIRNCCVLILFVVFMVCLYLYLRLFNTRFQVCDEYYYEIQYSTAWIVNCPGDVADLEGRRDYRLELQKCPYIRVLNVEEGITGIYRASTDRDGLNMRLKLNTVNLPSTLNEIGSGMFENCILLEKITWNETADNTQIHANAFCNTGITEINIPNGVTEIWYEAFIGNEYLKKVIIPDSVNLMMEDVFSNCVNLEEVTWSASLTEMEIGTFLGCTNLTILKNTDSLNSIAYNALSGTQISAEQILYKED